MWLQRHLRHLAGYNSLLWIIMTPTPEERSSGYESWGPCLVVLFCPMAPYCLLYFLPTPKMNGLNQRDSSLLLVLLVLFSFSFLQFYFF